MDSNKLARQQAQAPSSNKPRPRRWRIPRPTEAPKFPEPSPEQIQRHLRIRVERAVSLIAKSGCMTRWACRSVGLTDTGNETTVRQLCDERGIPRWRASVHSRALLQLRAPVEPRFKSETCRRVAKWRRANPRRQREIALVAHALASGEIMRGPCGKCGSDENIVAGPVELEPTLMVEWRCRRCSNAQRRKKGPEVRG